VRATLFLRKQMAADTFDDLDDLGLRRRVFYEMFPGTAAPNAWRAAFVAAHPHHPVPDPSESVRKPERDLDERLMKRFRQATRRRIPSKRAFPLA
jgi:hypothetical protein